jgi:hypothetical protein
MLGVFSLLGRVRGMGWLVPSMGWPQGSPLFSESVGHPGHQLHLGGFQAQVPGAEAIAELGREGMVRSRVGVFPASYQQHPPTRQVGHLVSCLGRNWVGALTITFLPRKSRAWLCIVKYNSKIENPQKNVGFAK